MNNEELYFKDCFTEIEEGKVNAEFNKATVKCFDSTNQAFSMDCEGNLVVNSIIAREGNNTSFSIDNVYPIGSIYMNVNATDPSTLFGGTWEQIKGRFLLGCGDNGDGVNYEANSTGGEATHTLNVNEIPSHNHNIWKRTASQADFSSGFDAMHFSGEMYAERYQIHFETANTGGGLAHNNMPPYLAIYMWKRVA